MTEKEIRSLLEGTGYFVEKRGSHIVVTDAAGNNVTGISSHTSHPKSAVRNFQSQLRRLGIDVPRKNHVKKAKR